MARSEDKEKRRRTRWTRGAPLLTRLRSAIGGFLFGRPVDDETAVRLREIKGLLLFGFSVWLGLSLGSFAAPYRDPSARGWNWGGQAGYYLADTAHLAVGLGAYVAVILCLAWSAILVGGRGMSWAGLRFFGGVLFVFSAAILLDLCFGDGPNGGSGRHVPYGYGGRLAHATTPVLAEKFGGPGLLVLLLVLAFVSFLLATERAFYPSVVAFRAWFTKRRREKGEGLLSAVAHFLGSVAVGLWNFLRGTDLDLEVEPATAPASSRAKPESSRAKPVKDLFDEEDVDDDSDEEEAAKPKKRVRAEIEEEDEDEEEEDDDEPEAEPQAEIVPKRAVPKKPPAPAKAKVSPEEPPTPPAGPWQFPPLDLLIRPEAGSGSDDRFLEDSAAKLEGALKSFRVEANVVGAQVGPAVTMFELSVAQGTRLNKVTQLSGEIAAALRAKSVRIIAPIPGRDTIGIEVPNLKRRVVRIRELVNQAAYDPKVMALPLFIGMDTEGIPIVEDLARMPHLLLAGTTGSGKSVCINTILCSLLLTRSPHDVKMILVDPKMVEMQIFANVPHLMCPVVTDARQATQVLLWACEKMEGRYELFKTSDRYDATAKHPEWLA